MFRGTPFATPRRNCRDVGFEALFLRAVRAGRQLDQRMKGDFHPRTLFLGHIVEIRIDAPQNRLMGDDDHVLAPLQFHDDGLEADDDISVRLATAIAVVVFVLVSGRKVFGIPFRDLLVGQAIADPRVKLVERFPLELVVTHLGCQVASSLNRPLQG